MGIQDLFGNTRSIWEYKNLVSEFNSLSGFIIQLPKNERVFESLIPFIDELGQMKLRLIEYERIRNRGYSDDHLATEIGSFVLRLNQITNEVRITT